MRHDRGDDSTARIESVLGEDYEIAESDLYVFDYGDELLTDGKDDRLPMFASRAARNRTKPATTTEGS
jgi:hypothetical protein